MIKLAICITHNKTDQENFDQIEKLKTMLKRVDEHYEIAGLDLPHELKVYQILPYQPDNPRLVQGLPYEGVWPKNAHDINSHKVAYGSGDEDKTGDHPRFFNWGLKRSTDYGAEAVIHLDNPESLVVEDLAPVLNTLVDPTDKTVYEEDLAAKYSTLTMLKEEGQIDESKTTDKALTELKDKIEQKEVTSGEIVE